MKLSDHVKSTSTDTDKQLLSNPELIEDSRKKLMEELTKEKESILATNKRDTV